MGHIGLTPQSVHQLGGYRIQGKDAETAQRLLEEARQLEKAGAFALVLECVPDEVAAWITRSLSIPTIGIGAGVNCDGQVLVYHDLLQYGSEIQPSFVKTYAQLGEIAVQGIRNYVQEVREGSFPGEKHTFRAPAVVDYLTGERKNDSCRE